MKSVWTKAGLISAVAVMATPASLSAQSDSSSSANNEAAAIVATQLRAQGYKCEDPHDGQHDKDASIPGEQVWIVTCDNATYRVRLVPDQAAKVEVLD